MNTTTVQGSLLDRSGRMWAEDDTEDKRLSPFGPIRKGITR